MYKKPTFRNLFKVFFSGFVIITFMYSRFGIDNVVFSADRVKEIKVNRSQVSSKTL